MIKDKNIALDYFNLLVDAIFKILPLYEEDNEGLYSYIDSMIFNLKSLEKVVGKDNGYKYITILLILNSIKDEVLKDSSEHKVIKREVFKCIGIVKEIVKNIESSV